MHNDYSFAPEKLVLPSFTIKMTNAANSFEKDFFRLMINSVYGKTMENVRKRINVRLANNEKDSLKYTSRPTHIAHKSLLNIMLVFMTLSHS